jgi:hypothetical protein
MVAVQRDAGKGPGKPQSREAPARPMLEMASLLSLDHVGNRSSPKLREFEIRQVGSRREGVLIIGAMAISCILICMYSCTKRWVRRAPARERRGLGIAASERACTSHFWRPKWGPCIEQLMASSN